MNAQEELEFRRKVLLRNIAGEVELLKDLFDRKARGLEFAGEENGDITDMHIFNAIDEITKFKAMYGETYE